MALLIRFVITCIILSLSKYVSGRLFSSETARVSPLFSASTFMVPATSSTALFMSSFSILNTTLPCSSFCISRMSFMNLVSLSTFLLVIFRNSFCFCVISPTLPSEMTAIPSFMIVNGVLISCDAMDMKSLFIIRACSSFLAYLSRSFFAAVSSEVLSVTFFSRPFDRSSSLFLASRRLSCLSFIFTIISLKASPNSSISSPVLIFTLWSQCPFMIWPTAL